MDLILLNIKDQIETIKEIWTAPNFGNSSSYFLSWSWIENWLTSLPDDISLQFAFALEKDVPILAFFLGRHKFVRKKIFRSHGLSINVTGYKKYDFPLWIEYNSMLSSSDTSDLSLKEIIKLLPDKWDELFLPGLDVRFFPGNCLEKGINSSRNPLKTSKYRVVIESDLPSFYVDLSLVREKGGNYIALLSSNTRSQIRRSYRGYETKGVIELEEAKSIDRAMEIFNELFELHKKRYREMNKRSNFITDYSRRFHSRLIKKCFDKGEIQLLRVTCGSEIIGCIYNFVYKGRVFFYQNGINYPGDKRLKPGLVCHTEAIKYNAVLNNLCYDFLAGNERYKSSLSTNKRRLIWAKIQKPKFMFELESKLLKTFSSIKRRSKK